MGKYVTKNQEIDEKRVVSVRIRRPVFDAFRAASIAAKEFGYSMPLSGVFETAMEDAISEFKEISGIDFKDIAGQFAFVGDGCNKTFFIYGK